MTIQDASALATRLAEKMVRNDKFQIEWWNQTIDMLPPNAAVVAAELLPLLQSQEAAEDENSGTSMNPISLKIRGLQSENQALRALVGRMRETLNRHHLWRRADDIKNSDSEYKGCALFEITQQAIEEADKVVN